MDSVVYVVNNVLSSQQIDSLITECDHYRVRYAQKTSPLERGAAIDVFEDVVISEDHSARSSPDAYFALRFQTSQSLLTSSNQLAIQSVISQRLPTLLRSLPVVSNAANVDDPSDNTRQSWYLFNEHYVVKEPRSELAFRWHTDADEQLAAAYDSIAAYRPDYFSIWLPLDDVSESNGTIYVPSATDIQYFEGPEAVSSRKRSRCSMEANKASKVAPVGTRCVDKAPHDDDIGIPIKLQRGSALVFGSTVWHRSAINDSDSVRRVFYAQYSRTPIVVATTIERGNHVVDSPLCFAVPF